MQNNVYTLQKMRKFFHEDKCVFEPLHNDYVKLISIHGYRVDSFISFHPILFEKLLIYLEENEPNYQTIFSENELKNRFTLSKIQSAIKFGETSWTRNRISIELQNTRAVNILFSAFRSIRKQALSNKHKPFNKIISANANDCGKFSYPDVYIVSNFSCHYSLFAPFTTSLKEYTSSLQNPLPF